MKLHVVVVAYHKAIPLRGLVDSFVLQTNPNWVLCVVHDGPAPEDVKDVMAYYKDDRITLLETAKRKGFSGHPNRKMMLQKMSGDSDDWVLLANDDNYYVPAFVEYFLAVCDKTTGMVYCNTVHSYRKYNLHYSKVEHRGIDMGSFIVRLDIAKATGFNHKQRNADGRYAVACKAACRKRNLKIKYINKFLFVHN